MDGTEHIAARVAAALRERAPSLVAAWSDDLREIDPDCRLFGHLRPIAFNITESVAIGLETGTWACGNVIAGFRRLALLRLTLGEPWAPLAQSLRSLTRRLRHAAWAELNEIPTDPSTLLQVADRITEVVESLWDELVSALDDQDLAHRMRYGQQLASLGRPLAHDLRNHAYAVRMQLRLLSEEHVVGDPDHRERLLRRAREALQGVGAVTTDHIERWLSEPGPPSPPAVFADLLSGLVQQLRATHPEAEVLVGGAAPCRQVPDGDRLWLALYLLATFALSRCNAGPARMVFRSFETLDALHVEMCTDGPRLDPMELTTLFDAPRPEDLLAGNVSGPWIARRALVQLGGDVLVQESSRSALVFAISLPRPNVAARAV